MLPVVSIICCTYNHEPFIRQCLDGFMMQKTDFSFEVLIHDDASTDNTAEIIREYELKYPDKIFPIYATENKYSKGIDIFSQILLPKAKGKYIAICEGDDYWTDPLKLQKQVMFLESHYDYSMCFHRAKLVSDIRYRKKLMCSEIEDREYDSTELFKTWTVPTASILFRKESLDYELHREDDILNGDIKIILLCCSKGKVRGMSSEMSVYRIHNGGVSYDVRMQDDRCMRYPNHYRAIKRNFKNIDSAVINEYLARSYINRANIRRNPLCKMHDYFSAIIYMPKANLIDIMLRKVKKIMRCLLE